jgi:hypothetical protein
MDRARQHPWNRGGRYARKMLDRLIIGERCGCMPQDRRTAPGHRGPSAPSGRNRRHQGSNPGAYGAYGAFSAHLFGGAPALYPPVGLAQGAYLSFLSYFAYFYRRRPKGGCLGIYPSNKRRVAHISLVFREIWDSTVLYPGFCSESARSIGVCGNPSSRRKTSEISATRRSIDQTLALLKPVVSSCANEPAKQLAEKLGRAMKGVPLSA